MKEDRDWEMIFRARRQTARSRKPLDPNATAGLQSDSTDPGRRTRLPPDRFANYELIGEIHRGGQGVVYEAMQVSTRRRVAIKVLREGPFAGAADRVRFEREIQVLAGLRHSNIVTIHDSGTNAGFFYFVMDHIPGRHLDEYVRDVELTTGRKLDIDACLRLFKKICDAVNAAHLRGVIHRDLKPSNIRVDADAEPHILDFGLAKLTAFDDNSDTQAPAQTITGQFVGSLPWASPEQSEGRTDEMDVRTDVYSLGVLLFQMLTGEFPYPVIGNMRTVVDNISNAVPKAPASLRRDIDGELETIVLKCLSKEPARRYQSAGELARDIDRYLRGEAIDAKRDSTTYLIGKHIRRHKVPFSLTVALMFSILGSSIWLGVLYRDARSARDNERDQRQIAENNLKRAEASERDSRRDAATARETTAFLSGLLENANPTTARGKELTVAELLDIGAQRIHEELADQPEVRFELLNTIATAYRELGRFEDARDELTQVLAEQRDRLGPDHPMIARTLHGLARIEYLGTDHAHAEQLAREALDMRKRLYGKSHPQIAASLALMGVLYMDRDDFNKSEACLQEALAIFRECQADAPNDVDPTNVAACMSRLASLDERKGNFAAAESKYREALAIFRQAAGDEHPDVATTLADLALTLQYRRDFDGAEALLKEALEIDRRVYGDRHPMVATCLNILGTNYYHIGDYAEAEKLFTESLAIRRIQWGDEHDEVATSLNNLAALKGHRGDFAGARELFEEVLRIYRKIWGDDHSQIAAILNNLAAVSRQLQDYPAAENYYREALEIGRKHFDDDHPGVRISLAGLGAMQLKRGDAQAAERALRDVLAIRQRAEPKDEWGIALARSTLGECLLGLERYEEAEPLILNSFQTIESVAGDRPQLQSYRLEAIQRIIDLYDATDRHSDADAWRKRLKSGGDSDESPSP